MEPITHTPGSRKLLRTGVAVTVVAGLAVGAWLAITHWRQAPPTTYATTETRRGEVVSAATATGTLSPVVQVEVGSQVSGRVAELMVDYNDQVRAGQVIARIDPQLFESAVAQAKARLGSARADLTRAQAIAANAKAQHDRVAGLIESGAVARAEVDSALADRKAAESQVVSARASITEATASLELARANLAYTTITSPIDGIVISRSVDVGQTVAASLSAPILFVIAGDLRQMEVHTSVAESDVGQLTDGMKVEFSVDAFPEKTFTGTVKQVRFEATNVSNVVTYDAVVEVRNDSLELRPGMTANVTFVIAERRDVLVVPTRALRYRPATATSGGADRPRERGRRRAGEAPTEAATAVEREPRATVAASTAPSATGAEPAPRATERAPRRRGEAVWVLRDGAPVRLEVQTGLSDGTVTEIVAGELAEGDLVITGDSTAPAARPAANTGRRAPRGAF